MSPSDFDPWRLRRDYAGPSFDETTLADTPMAQFLRWFEDAERGGVDEPNAMVVATVDATGMPRQRTVLMKGFSDDGIVFYTNYESAKGRQIEANPKVSLLFGWYAMHRQVIVTGTATTVDRSRTERYFERRPRGAQLAAWASRQSQPVASRAELEESYLESERRFDGVDVPAPPHWGGYRVTPETVEFWQGRTNRLHDRLRYMRRVDGAWCAERLAP